LVPILNHLSLGFTASEYTSSPSVVGAVNAAQIDQVKPPTFLGIDWLTSQLVKHYPLCMRNLHKSLRRDKHLKHYGRLQYGLFLKVKTTESYTDL
jgi:DNA primase large subunit